jgi:DNA-binding NarL/FixJ family response regulator
MSMSQRQATVLISVEHQGEKIFSNGRELLVTADQRQRLLGILDEIAKRYSGRRQWRGLTTREWDVVQRIKGGASNKQIAKDLNLAPGTIKAVVHRILGKVDVSSRLQLAISSLPTSNTGAA